MGRCCNFVTKEFLAIVPNEFEAKRSEHKVLCHRSTNIKGVSIMGIEKTLACKHSARSRYTTGFYCEDCGVFVKKGTQEYRRSGELIASISMVLHNKCVDFRRKNEIIPEELTKIEEEVDNLWHKGIGDSEKIITRAEVFLLKYGLNSDSADITLQ